MTGIVASIASYLVLAADEIIAEENAVFMIHNAYSFAVGDHKDLRKTADHLERSSSLLANAYSSKTGKSVDELKAMMDEETFIYGKDIITQGFADSSFEDESQEAKGQDLAMAFAKEQINYCSSEMKANKMASEDLEKAAAYLKGFNHSPEAKQGSQDFDNHKKNPQHNSNNKKEDKMTLDEFLAQNPEAKAKYDSDLKAEYHAGEAKQKETLTSVSAYLKPESAYGAPLAELALKVASGEEPKSSLTAAVAVLDIQKEQAKSKDAKDDSDASPDTPPDEGGQEASTDGKIRNAVDESAAIAKLKTQG